VKPTVPTPATRPQGRWVVFAAKNRAVCFGYFAMDYRKQDRPLRCGCDPLFLALFPLFGVRRGALLPEKLVQSMFLPRTFSTDPRKKTPAFAKYTLVNRQCEKTGCSRYFGLPFAQPNPRVLAGPRGGTYLDDFLGACVPAYILGICGGFHVEFSCPYIGGSAVVVLLVCCGATVGAFFLACGTFDTVGYCESLALDRRLFDP